MCIYLKKKTEDRNQNITDTNDKSDLHKTVILYWVRGQTGLEMQIKTIRDRRRDCVCWKNAHVLLPS